MYTTVVALGDASMDIRTKTAVDELTLQNASPSASTPCFYRQLSFVPPRTVLFLFSSMSINVCHGLLPPPHRTTTRSSALNSSKCDVTPATSAVTAEHQRGCPLCPYRSWICNFEAGIHCAMLVPHSPSIPAIPSSSFDFSRRGRQTLLNNWIFYRSGHLTCTSLPQPLAFASGALTERSIQGNAHPRPDLAIDNERVVRKGQPW